MYYRHCDKCGVLFESSNRRGNCPDCNEGGIAQFILAIIFVCWLLSKCAG